MDWKECCWKRVVKEVKSDKNLITSLIKSGNKRMESVDMLKTDATTSESKLSLAYDSLREVLEALASKKGYKIYNHECYTGFLKEVMKESLKGDEFDDIRKIRNSVNYYGKEIAPEDANIIINRIKLLRLQLLKSVNF